MANLYGTFPGLTYKQLLTINSGNNGLTGSIQYINDGSGTPSILGLSTTDVAINATSVTINSYALTVSGISSISGTNTGDQTITLTGAVTGSGTGSFATTLANNSVVYAKIQQTSVGAVLIGNPTVSAANVEEITLNSTLAFSGTTIERAALTGDITAPAGSNTTTLATVNTNTGSFGSEFVVPSFTVNAKGLITAASSNTAISLAALGAVGVVTTQSFTTSGTYTPTSGMLYCLVQMVGGGGGSGGAITTTSTTAASGGGGGGEYAQAVFSAATIGASQTVTIGAAGAAGTNSPGNGGTGGTTSLGGLLTAIGGTGSLGVTYAGAPGVTSPGGVGGTGGSGTAQLRVAGQQGSASAGLDALNLGITGAGGSSRLGFGGANQTQFANTATIGLSGTGYGSGASGSMVGGTSGAVVGKIGNAGVLIVTEFCS